ncbi:hypothetical protein BDV93DRAFT_606759 [Ceratobasidium sp. AG-I]|nr:hypothetical protein BDV93DRAFT_606759 [Ceratobasidium sp. AG-I]
MSSSKHTSTQGVSGRSRLSKSQPAASLPESSSATSRPAASSSRTRSREQVPTFPEASTYKYEAAPEYMRPPAPGYVYTSRNVTLTGPKSSPPRTGATKSRFDRSSKSTKQSASAPATSSGSQLDRESHYSGESTPPLSASAPYDDASTVDEHELKTPISPQSSTWPEASHAPEPQAKPRSRRRANTVRFADTPDEIPASRSADRELPPRTDSSDDSSRLHRAFGKAQVDRIIYDFNTLVLNFKFPSNIDFMPLQNDKLFPSLAYTPQNKSLLEHKQKLDGVLEKLDGVESHGDEEVRRVRKDAVGRVQKALEVLNQMQAMVWFNRQYEQRMAKA